MVLDLGFLGDTVHLLPALWMVRQAVSAGGTARHRRRAHHGAHGLCAMGESRWGYTRYPRHATLRENFQMVARIIHCDKVTSF